MLNSLEIILHPPELKGKERRRFWLAAAGWMAVVLSLLGLMGGAILFLLWRFESYFESPAFKPYEDVLLIVGIAIVIGSVIGGDRLWFRLFIQSGYLSDAATIRILSNRAPTKTGERRHRWLGQVILLIVYGVMGVVAIMAKQWWALIIVIPLGVWGVFLIRNAWKDADVMLKGGAIPPASEERIHYIEKVLDERSQNK